MPMIFNKKFAALVGAGTATFLVGCSKDETQSSSQNQSHSTLTCNGTQCPNASEYCCAGVGTAQCHKKSDVAKDSNLKCGVVNGSSWPSTDSSTTHTTNINTHSSTTTTGNAGAKDPRECCPPHMNTGSMIIQGNTVVIDGKTITDSQCYDGTPVANYKNADGSCKLSVNKNGGVTFDNAGGVDNVTTGDVPAGSVIY